MTKKLVTALAALVLVATLPPAAAEAASWSSAPRTAVAAAAR